MTLTSKEKVDQSHSHHFTIRKISSEDDVGGTPRSHYAPKVVSVYADSIRRQRSDSFVHSYNHNKLNVNSSYQSRTLSIHRPIHTDIDHDDDDDDDDGIDSHLNDDSNIINYDTSTSGDDNSDMYLTVDGNTRTRISNNNGSSSSSFSSTSAVSSPSLHINTNSATATNSKSGGDTGAILEGVLIRRAIRPASHLAQQQQQQQQQQRQAKDDTLTSLSPKEITPTATTPNTSSSTPATTSPNSTPDDITEQPTPWLPPSLTANPTSSPSSMSSPSQEDDNSPVASVVSKLLPRKEKSIDDKHPSLFKRLAQLHHHHGPRLYRDDQLHEIMRFAPSPTVTMDQDTELDRHGFQKATQWITLETYHDFEKFYQPILERRLLRWQQLLDENDAKLPDRCAQVKRYVRKGVPSHLRGRVWFHYSGAEAKMDANPGVYEKFLKRAQELGDENEFADLIERDLHRTFPDNIQFSKAAATAAAAAAQAAQAAISQATNTNGSSSPIDTTTPVPPPKPPAIDVLRRVLSAFSVYCPSVGYCQSLNYLAGMLLLFLKEEEAFWSLATIAQTILPAGVYDVTMEGASIDQAVLMMLIYERMPQLWYKMTDKTFWEAEADGVSMPTITLVTSHWFLTLFINILPTETVLRVWDCFFYEGSSVLFRIALALFKMSEPIICDLNDPLEIFQMIQNFPKRIIDCQMLMDNAFRRYGSLTDVSSEDLDRRREICRELRKARRFMIPNEIVTSANKSDTSLRKRWKLAVNPSSSTHHHFGGTSK